MNRVEDEVGAVVHQGGVEGPRRRGQGADGEAIGRQRRLGVHLGAVDVVVSRAVEDQRRAHGIQHPRHRCRRRDVEAAAIEGFDAADAGEPVGAGSGQLSVGAGDEDGGGGGEAHAGCVRAPAP